MEQITKKQHFVPRFYLKAFADHKEFLQVLDIENNRIAKPRPYGGVGYAHYFYAAETGTPDDVSQFVEEWLRHYEGIISGELTEIIRKIHTGKEIDDDDRYILASLMCMLWLRAPGMRSQLNKMEEDVTKQMMKLRVPGQIDSWIKSKGKEISAEQRQEIIETFETGSYKLKFNNAQHLRFMTSSFGFGEAGFINMFFGHKWKIYIAKGEKRFVTSDNPVVEWWIPPQGFYGASFLERNKYFSLTPEIFIELTYPEKEDAPVETEIIYKINDHLVEQFNILPIAYADKFAYSGVRLLLQKVVDGRKNPGRIEMGYYERFERPLRLAREGRNR